MKKQFISLFFILLLTIVLTSKVKSQTAGTLTFTYTQAAPTTQATKNVMAVWIENNAGTFIKTKMCYWSSGTNDHLPTWVSKSAQSVVDASTGATRTASTSPTAFGAKTITWNGTNASGTLVADGVYNIYIESSYCNPQPATGTHWLITNFTFTKGPTAQHLTPTGPTNFSGITIDWVPAGATVNEVSDNNKTINMYPNPVANELVIEFNDNTTKQNFEIYNSTGQVIYKGDIINKTIVQTSGFAPGIYMLKLDNGKTFEFKKLVKE